MRASEVLLRVLAAGEGVLGDHPRADAALAGVVDDRHVRDVQDLPAGPLDPQAEVGLLGVDEEALVHAAGAQQGLPARQHVGARGPVALEARLVEVEVENPLTGPAGSHGPAL